VTAAPPLVSKPFHAALIDHGHENPHLFVVTNDLTASCEADGFRDAFPDRYLSAGMAEQALVAALAGLAREGFQPLYPTFAVFATRRPYEQVALTVAYPALPVRLFGFLPGLTTPGGVTHQATDDIGLMAGLPNMTVVEAADATDMATVLRAVAELPGPVYVRSLRGQVPRLFDTPLQIGNSRRIVGDTGSDEVLVIVSGSPTAMAMSVVNSVRTEYPGLGLVNVSTLKPFADAALLAAIAAARVVITVENHLVASGLGSIVCRHVAQHPGPRVVTLGIADTFTHGGSTEYLMRYYGPDEQRLHAAIAQAYGRTPNAAPAPTTGGPGQPGEGDGGSEPSTIALTAEVAEGL